MLPRKQTTASTEQQGYQARCLVQQGTFLDAVQTGQGLYDQALDLSPDSNAKERAAYRMLASRIPFVGGNRLLAQSLADIFGGEDTTKKEKALNYSANYGTKYGSNYGAKY